ncbi:transposase [Novosphingobium sp. PhB165]|uniref:transposase n=1 Tax=Novosphingobium sp. PhB165 TaxID=2485105 RepID=UPI001FB1FD3F|nr:transposase [Novosphingobium sp. PhB165]
MTRRDPTAASLAECAEALAVWGFDPEDDINLSHAANWLQRLGNDRQFLGDVLVDLLAGLAPVPADAEGLVGAGPQAVMLVPPGRGDFSIRARIWPSPREAAYRASGPAACGYGEAQDFASDVLSLGYFGPGYLGEDYEYDPEAVIGHVGEQIALRLVGRGPLDEGRLIHYRACRDVLLRDAPETLSVSIDLVHTDPAQGWGSHHTFDVARGEITDLLGHGPSESFLRIAVALGGEAASELATRFGASHPSERMRLVAWQALAAQASDQAARDSVWQAAERSGSRLVAQVAKAQRQQGERGVGS